jgi:hypothetical protein
MIGHTFNLKMKLDFQTLTGIVRCLVLPNSLLKV